MTSSVHIGPDAVKLYGESSRLDKIAMCLDVHTGTLETLYFCDAGEIYISEPAEQDGLQPYFFVEFNRRHFAMLIYSRKRLELRSNIQSIKKPNQTKSGYIEYGDLQPLFERYSESLVSLHKAICGKSKFDSDNPNKGIVQFLWDHIRNGKVS